jgi:DMSO/TMAO reductase YedYZ molybdopterin-dependent catalytic subunit
MACEIVPTRHRASLAVLACAVAALCTTGRPARAQTTTSFDLTGAVNQPGSYDLADLQAFPPVTESVTYGAATGQVSTSYTGASLYTLLSDAGLQAPPGAKNGTLRDVVVATGSDGYAVAFSTGELNPAFGGKPSAPDLVAYASNGAPLGTDGFARTTAPGDTRGGRYVSSLASLNVVQAPNNPSQGGGPSTSLTLSGLVSRPGTYDAAALAALPSLTESVTYLAGGSPVSATYTGVSLWTLLTDAGLVTDPSIKNDELRDYVVATGSDGYEATFSLGELDPAFGGSTTAPDLIAYAEGSGQSLGSDGFARIVVPGDSAGGRYVSNLVSLQVIDATAANAVPEPASLALLVPALLGIAGLCRAGRRLG